MGSGCSTYCIPKEKLEGLAPGAHEFSITVEKAQDGTLAFRGFGPLDYQAEMKDCLGYMEFIHVFLRAPSKDTPVYFSSAEFQDMLGNPIEVFECDTCSGEAGVTADNDTSDTPYIRKWSLHAHGPLRRVVLTPPNADAWVGNIVTVVRYGPEGREAPVIWDGVVAEPSDKYTIDLGEGPEQNPLFSEKKDAEADAEADAEETTEETTEGFFVAGESPLENPTKYFAIALAILLVAGLVTGLIYAILFVFFP